LKTFVVAAVVSFVVLAIVSRTQIASSIGL
jgi:hypothetical protein